MSSEDDAIGSTYYAPVTMEKLRAKKAELNAAVFAGTMSSEAAASELRRFRMLAIAHHREHGSEEKL